MGASMGPFWRKFRQKAFAVKTIDGTLEKAQESGEMRKTLGAVDLTMLGVGAIVGAGVFVLTGEAAGKFAGPSVILSYLISSMAAILSAMSYVEFAVDMPVAGGAFNFINLVFGEFIAWQVGFTLILEYTLGASAVSKGFSGYLASLFGLETDALTIDYTIFELDILAVSLVIFLSILLMFGSKESSTFNMIVTGINLTSILLVLLAAFPNSKAKNFSPFFPNGSRGLFEAAGLVFFAYIGFDTLATASEEVKNPGKDLPIGIVGSLCICSVLYGLMAAAISGLQRYDKIDVNAPFSEAFADIDLRWLGDIVSVGALTGIVTSVLVNLMGQARVYLILGRERLLPPWIAEVNEKRSTPIRATIVTGCFAGTIALLFDIDFLSRLVSVGTLFVLGMVSLGVLVRRYYKRGEGTSGKPMSFRLAILVISAMAEGLAFSMEWHIGIIVAFLVLWLGATISLCFLPTVFTPTIFSVPLKPFLPSLAILATVHLIFSLGWEAHMLFVLWQAIGVVVYLTYGLHHSQSDLTEYHQGLATEEGAKEAEASDSSRLVSQNAVSSDAVVVEEGE
ncbi:hypothetical protein BSKO_04547 [Bryopsis sp. KO-2023]|nr:hypothetical protein BSKO_04547 [Bryopsis sp. KO-2023]